MEEWFSNQEMSRGEIGMMWIIRKSTKGLELRQASLSVKKVFSSL